MRALLACLLTLTSIFGMLSKPIRDWIPEFPALHRWIIPVERPRQLNYIERETAEKESKCCVGAERRSSPDQERKAATMAILLDNMRDSLSSLSTKQHTDSAPHTVSL